MITQRFRRGWTDLISMASFQNRRINRRMVCGKASRLWRTFSRSRPGRSTDRGLSDSSVWIVNLCPGYAANLAAGSSSRYVGAEAGVELHGQDARASFGNEVRQVTFRKEHCDGRANGEDVMATADDLSKKTALRFVVLLGVVSLFADMTYEGAEQYRAVPRCAGCQRDGGGCGRRPR